MQYFPVNIRCSDANIVVVGGDPDAVAKIRLLLKTDAHISVFADQIDPAIHAWHEAGKLKHVPRMITLGDLVSVRLAYISGADATPIAPQESYHNLAVTILERINLDAGDSNMDLSASLLGKYITSSDGNNVIRDTIYPDIIIAGKGDDTIYLYSSPYDYNNIIYHIGHRLAWDGADHIIGFSRGSGRQIPDKFIFALESHTATRAISNYQGFLDYVTKGTDTLDDDEFLVQLKIGMDDDGNVQMEGLYFHFAGSPHYHDGRVSLPLVQIQFAEPVNEACISDIFKDDNNRPVVLTDILDKNLVLTDLDYLDDILGGENAIDYIIVPELV
ncbi:MAG: precorrin-2 dehydrogenase/sirohydrochlorin ferrochelatase family protein [Candidatus Puniceispirillales bacterium]